MNVIEGRNLRIRLIKCILLSAAAFFFGPFLLIPGFRKLKRMPPEDGNRIILKAALAAGSIAYALTACFIVIRIAGAVFFSDRNPEFGEHAKQVSWLMPEATDISYCLSFSFSAYEFSITEEAFRKALSKRPLREITHTVRIRRYNYLQDLPEKERTVTVTNGLAASEKGLRGHYTVVYDRTTSRAYFEESPNRSDDQNSM